MTRAGGLKSEVLTILKSPWEKRNDYKFQKPRTSSLGMKESDWTARCCTLISKTPQVL